MVEEINPPSTLSRSGHRARSPQCRPPGPRLKTEGSGRHAGITGLRDPGSTPEGSNPGLLGAGWLIGSGKVERGEEPHTDCGV